MKAIVFICLLSLSLALSKPASESATPTKEEAAKSNATPEHVTEHTASPAKPTQASNPAQASNPPQAGNSAQTVTTATSGNPPPAEHPTEVKPGEPAAKVNTTENQSPKAVTPNTNEKVAANTTATNVTKKNETAPATAKPTEATKPEEKDATTKPGKDVSTTEKAAVKSTEAPTDTTAKPAQAGRSFDGASFIGGIILTLGLLAIGFIGFKYFKNQTESNYHTL